MRQELIQNQKSKVREKEELTMENMIKLFRTTKVEKCEGVFAIGHKRCAIGLIHDHFFNTPEHILELNSYGSLDDHCRLQNFFHENGLTTLELMAYNDSYTTFKDIARAFSRIYHYKKRNPNGTLLASDYAFI